jgi:hypothetical protein
MRQIEFLDSEIAEVERLDRLRRARVDGDPTADGRARGERDRRRDASWQRSVTSTVSKIPASSWATSAWTRACDSPDPDPRPMGTSQSRARSGHATHWSRRAGARSASPGRCTRSISASVHAADTPSRSSRRPASSRACSGRCSHGKQDYAYAAAIADQAKKLRLLEITAGAPTATQGKAAGIYSANTAVREAERELARQAEVAYARTVRDWHAAQAKNVGASATPGRASNKPSKGKAARQTTSP